MPEFLGKRKRKDSWANSSVPERKEPKYGELKGDEEDRGKSREAQGLPRSGPHKTASVGATERRPRGHFPSSASGHECPFVSRQNHSPPRANE